MSYYVAYHGSGLFCGACTIGNFFVGGWGAALITLAAVLVAAVFWRGEPELRRGKS